MVYEKLCGYQLLLYHSLSELSHDLDHTTQFLILLHGTSSNFPVDSVIVVIIVN